ncbi:Fc receptor-like B isoform X3 [Prionailurus viverrinus]|uniref:Fc receptor-like B isoform X3 n=1 Tax=Prionailurus viverrinus TaxID=61388 RepID=UPI001FF472D8|nr:Fc receptor-like B isoform X3 [Prionailurus viverrinus]
MGERSRNASQDSGGSTGHLLSLLPHPTPGHLHRSGGRSVMWSLTALLLLVPSGGQAATLEKPVLSLHPPWTTIFKGERVTLRCDGYHPPLLELRPISTLWYSGHLLLPSHKKSIEVQTPGVYRCQTRGAPVSDPIHLSVSNELFPAPVLRVAGRAEARGGVAVRCDTRLHPQKRDTPLQFAFYKYSRPVRRFDWGAEYTVPEPEVEELESYWCEAATATRSVRKRSPWLQLPGRGAAPDSASTTAPVPQAAALAPGNQPLSFRKPPVSRSAAPVTSVPNITSPGLRFPAGRAPTAGPPACAPPPTPWEPSAAAALKPDVDLLLREMQLLKGLLSRLVLELKEPQAFPEHGDPPGPPTSHLAVRPATQATAVVES